ncbi:hypothetical protein Bca101_008890 [Brassica carinata]
MDMFCGSRKWRIIGTLFTGVSLPEKNLYCKQAVGVYIPALTAVVLFDGGDSCHQKPHICSGHGDIVSPAFHYGILPVLAKE